MIVTGAFLADHAENRGEKLYVEGGAWRSAEIPKTRVPALVLLLDSGPDDYGTRPELVIEMSAPDGTSGVLVQQELAIDGPAAFAVVQRFEFPVTTGSGRYGFRCRLGEQQDTPAAFGLDVTVDEEWLRHHR